MQNAAWTRRSWLKSAAGWAGLAMTPSSWGGETRGGRDYHVCLAPPIIESEPALLDTVRSAGVSKVWVAGYFYGHRPYSTESIQRACRQVETAGMQPGLITIPLGHPGDSLGSKDGDFPLTPPSHWKVGVRPDGNTYAGTSLHAPATEENAKALGELRRQGFKAAFVDDDFRLARAPGEIGGCYCDEHRTRFLRRYGYSDSTWAELLEDVQHRRLTNLLRSWLEFTGAELSGAFRAQVRAFQGKFGVMAMYLGAEKAGLRLKDYREVPFRVGELMFDDGSFTPVKGKTDELFSALFHRRFARPELAFSETTAYPADRLNATNMAAKLVISTITDVRHTMFMSGLTPFPREHWAVLGPAMRCQKELHRNIAGAPLRGPLKHYWGESQRCVGDDLPFSLWLAMGIPFEVVDRVPGEGYVFLSDFDARDWNAPLARARLVCRQGAVKVPEGVQRMDESLDAVFAFKHQIRGELGETPHVLEDKPAVCAWYPSARKVLVWNLSNVPCSLTLVQRARRISQEYQPLEAKLVNVAPGRR